MSDRLWFLVFCDEDTNIESLLGPILGGEAEADELKDAYLALEDRLAEATDWHSPLLRTPYRPHYIAVMDYDEEELAALGFEP